MANTLSIVLERLHASAVPDDPSVCRISGYVRSIRGQPLAKRTFQFSLPENTFSIAGTTLLAPGRSEVRTDANGFLQVDLLRGAEVVVYLPELSAGLLRTVPDEASMDLVAWLFPYVVSVAYSGDNPLTVSLATDTSVPLTFTATLSDGTTVDLVDAVTLESDDLDVAQTTDQVVELLSVGTVEVTPLSLDYTKLPTNQLPNFEESLATHVLPPDPEFFDPITIIVTA